MEMGQKITKFMWGMLLAVILGMTAVIVINYFWAGRENPGEEPDYYFTFVCPLQWKATAAGIKAADEDYRANTKLVGSGRLNTEMQAQAIREAIAAKPDGIITAGMEDSQVLINALEEAGQAGIPVVLVDNDLPQTGRISYIGSDNQRLGEMAAEKMAALTEGEGQVCLIVSNLDNANQLERVEGFEDGLADYPQLQIAGIMECASEPLEVHQQYMEFMAENPDTTAVCCMEGRGAKAMGSILEDAGENMPQVVAVDYSTTDGSRPRKSVYGAILKQDMVRQGYLAVETLVRYLEGETVQDIQYTDIACYDRENLDDMRDISEEYDWRLY